MIVCVCTHMYHDAVVEVRKQLVELVFCITFAWVLRIMGWQMLFLSGHRILFTVCVDETAINTCAGQPA